MVFPLRPTLTNIFLCYNEQTWFDNYPIELNPAIYRRYLEATMQQECGKGEGGEQEASPTFS